MIYNNFKSKLHLACATDDLRPALQHIYFRNGYSYCTDAHMLIKQKLSVHDFSEDEIALTEGKHIHKDVFRVMHMQKRIAIVKDGFEAEIEQNTMLYRFSNMSVKPPDFESVFPKKTESVTDICFNLKLISRLQSIFIFGVHTAVDLKFHGTSRGIIVTANGKNKEDQVALIMPIMIMDDNF